MKVNDYIALIFQCHDNHVEFRGFVHVCGGHIPMAIPSLVVVCGAGGNIVYSLRRVRE